MAEEKHDAVGARPFQLRPSILSGTGFGSPFGSASANDKASAKGFMLRPSALSSAADKIESLHKTETRKRPHEEENELENRPVEDDSSKKSKVAEEAPKSESPVKLTEELEKPTGIGSFGFAQNSETNSANTNGSTEVANNEDVNYFQQGLNNTSNKLSFVFGTNSTSASVGFNALKNETSDTENNTDLLCDNEKDIESSGSDINKEQLLENADEYQKTHCHRRHFEEIEQFTGEEGEQHVLQVFCKLHLFDKETNNWLEKGRGTLKLNDIAQSEGVFQSRIVFRTQGTNIVLLNTKLWPDMCCQKVKGKSIRITAVEPETQELRVYLVTTNMKDCFQTFTAIDRRLQALQRNCESVPSQKNDDTQNENSNDSKTHTDDDEDSSTETESANTRQESTRQTDDKGTDDEKSTSEPAS